MFFDSHCHIDFAEFDDDRAEVLARASAAGVNGLLIPGVTASQWPQAESVSLACREAGFSTYRAVGLHPWWIDNDLLSTQELASQLTHNLGGDVIAVGECGLDALRGTAMATQIEVLNIHIEIAKQHNLPLILHCVKAHETLLQLLRQACPAAGGMVHGFGGSLEIAKQYWQLGFAIGVGAMATRPHASRAHRAFTELPIEALLLETDSPAMPVWGQQHNWSKMRNEPANIQVVAVALAELRGISVTQLAEQCRVNTQNIFGV